LLQNDLKKKLHITCVYYLKTKTPFYRLFCEIKNAKNTTKVKNKTQNHTFFFYIG